MRRRLNGTVAVVTGATSGLGRATALAFARQGVHLALAARDAPELDRVAATCETFGVQAVGIPTDISDRDGIDALATAAVAHFGKVDTWVNAASALVAGDLTATPPDELDELVDINVRGTMHASRAALSLFDAQNSGVLINVSSILGAVPNPVVPAYTMSKFAIHGLTAALYHARHGPVHVCLVMPGPIDTPMFAHAANHTGRELRAVPPSNAPERGAAAIVRRARRPRRRTLIGSTGRAIMLGLRIAPATTQWLVVQYSARLLTRRRPAIDTPGTLFEPAADGSKVHGGYRFGGSARQAAGRTLGNALAGRARSGAG